MRKIALLAVVAVCAAFLVACEASDKRKAWLTGCDTIAETLAVLAVMKDEMSAEEIAKVDRWKPTADRICKADGPPESGLAELERIALDMIAMRKAVEDAR